MRASFGPHGDFNGDRLPATGGDGQPGASTPPPQARAAFSGPPGLPQRPADPAVAASRPAQARSGSMDEQFHHGLLTAELPALRDCSVQAYRSDGTCVATTFEDVVNELAMGSTRQMAIASQFAMQSTRDEGNGLKSIAHGYHDPAYFDPPPVSHVEQAIEALADALPRCAKGFSFVTAQRWADVAPIVEASEHKPDLVLVLNQSRRSGWS